MPYPITGGGSGSTLASSTLTQTAHGFTIGNAVYWTGSAYAKGRADSATTSEVLGIVATVPTANTFTLATAGAITGLTGLTSGEVYWLSDVTAGLATTTQPTAVGSVSKPLFVATSATTAQIQIFDTAPASGQTAVVAHGEQVLTSTLAGLVNTTFANVTGMSMTLPSAGTYRIGYSAIGQVGTINSNMSLQLHDGTAAINRSIRGQNINVGASGFFYPTENEITVTQATTITLQSKVSAGTYSVVGDTTSGQTAMWYNQIGASPVPMDLVGEYGETTTITNGTTFGTTLTTIAGSSFTLPSAGIWEVTYNLFGALGGVANGTIGIYDSSNIIVPNSIGNIGSFGNSLVNLEATNNVFITTSGSATYHLKGQTTGSTMTISNLSTLGVNLAGNSKITWRKISGFLPSSGQTIDYIYAPLTATVTAANTNVTFTTSSGNITNDGTNFTLLAGKTYHLEAQLEGQQTTATASFLEYAWVDSANTLLVGSTLGITISATSTNTSSDSRAVHVFTPSSNMTVHLRTTANVANVTSTLTGRSYARITQLGTSATIAGVYPGTWTSYTPTVTSTGGTNPTLPTSATLTGAYSIQGKTMFLNIRYNAATIAGGADGTGSYQWSIPGGYVIDTTKAAIPSVLTNTAGSGLDGGVVGSGFGRNSTGGNSAGLIIMPLSTTTIGAYFEAATRLIGASSLAMTGASNATYSFVCQIPLV